MTPNPVRYSREGNDYTISAQLVHKLILAIFASMFSLVGYMVIWAVNDVKWKTTMESDNKAQTEAIIEIRTVLSGGLLPVTKARLDELNRRLDVLEGRPNNRHDRGE